MPELLDIGYAVRAHLALVESVANVSGFLSLFEDRRSRSVAKVLTVIAQTGHIRKVSTSLVIVTEFTDGTELGTTNTASPKIWPDSPTRREGA